MKYIIFLISILMFTSSCNFQKEENNYPTVNPADINATNSTVKLYTNLFQQLDNGVMIGHQDDLLYGNLWYAEEGRSDMKSVCGEYPAVFGWDLGKIETGSAVNVDSVEFEYMKTQIQKAHRMKGISTFTWNADNPATGGNAFDCSGTGVVNSILNGNVHNAKYLGYLDNVADFFLSLKDDNGNLIPVIFRPFQSSNKDLYWWNTEQCTHEEFKQLWKETFEYLTVNKKVNNLLYAYSIVNIQNAGEFNLSYPGNDYVDIIGSEIYFMLEDDPEGVTFKKDLERNLSLISSFSSKNKKIPALTETGLEGIKIFNFFSDYIYPAVTKYPVSYSMFWKNSWNNSSHYHIPIPGHPACEDFILFTKKQNIITCAELESI